MPFRMILRGCQVSHGEFIERVVPDTSHSHLLPGSTSLLVSLEYF